MNKSYGDLGGEELRVLAGIRLSMVARLCEAVAAQASGTNPETSSRDFSLGFGVPGTGLSARLARRDGTVRAWFTSTSGEKAPWSATSGFLLFPGSLACAKALSGGKGAILPVPLSPSFAAGLSFFRAAARRAPELLAAPATSPEVKAELLLAATLGGLAAAAADPYLAPRLDHFPDGIVEIACGEKQGRGLGKRGRSIRILDAPAAPFPDTPSAVLRFASAEAAVAVLSGKRPAVVALGSGEVSIHGLLPLVQGLFAVLDRLSWYLALTPGNPKEPHA